MHLVVCGLLMHLVACGLRPALIALSSLGLNPDILIKETSCENVHEHVRVPLLLLAPVVSIACTAAVASRAGG